MTVLHVVPDQRATWRVYETETPAPLSEHTNATDAERPAQARSNDRGAERVVVHDRYNRTHDLDSSPWQQQEGASAPAPANSTQLATEHAGSPASNNRNATVRPAPGRRASRAACASASPGASATPGGRAASPHALGAAAPVPAPVRRRLGMHEPRVQQRVKPPQPVISRHQARRARRCSSATPSQLSAVDHVI
jgi:hypothetical protein